MTRTWTDGTGLALSASNLNSLEADVTAALGVPDAALAARVQAGATKTALDARYATNTALSGKEPAFSGGTTGQFLRGDKTWQAIAVDGIPKVNTYAELQTAVLAGGVIHLGDESIEMTGTINITQPTWIVGGEILLPLDANYPAFYVTSSNVSFFMTRITGPSSSATYLDTARFIHAEGTDVAPLSNVNVMNCTLKGTQSEAIRFTWVKGSSISENYIDDYLYAGIMMLSCDNIDVTGNTVINGVMKAPVVNVYGIAATDMINTTAARSKRIRIIGNHIENCPWEGIDTHGGDTIIIIGNTLVACSRAIALVVGNVTRVTVPTNCIVQGNFVVRSTAVEDVAISLWGLSGTPADANIIGNTVRGYSAANAIFLSFADSTRTLVEGNSHPHIPWTDMPMTNTSQWTANSSFKPQYMVEGRRVHLRGFLVPAAGLPANSTVTQLPAICAVDRSLVFAGVSHGSNAAAGIGTVVVDNTAQLFMNYRTTADTYSYPIECSYIRAFG